MRRIVLFGMAAVMMAACEKPIMGDAYDVEDANANVVLRFTPYGQQGFTRAATQLTDQCSRLSVAIFRQDGTKVKSVNQSAGNDGSFGTVAVSLTEGTYKVVAVAHNSTEGNATISSTEKVTFANNKMTDTFCYCGDLVVGTEPVNKELQMQRVVAMVRLTINGTIPDDVARFKFYYTGGSSTLNPSTGYGCVNSKQTEYRAIVVDGSPVNTYDLYTSPHELNDVLKLVITAQDADNSTVNEWTMENVPVTKNKITTWTGSLFSNDGGGPSTDGSITITLDTTWGGTVSYTW